MIDLSLVIAMAAWCMSAAGGGRHGACSNTAEVLKTACAFEVADDFATDHAACINFEDDEVRSDCKRDARMEARDTTVECREVFSARLDLCDEIGEGRYDPDFGEEFAASFVDPLQIGGAVAPNPYFPLVPGTVRVYEKTFIDDEGEEVTETVTVTVTDRTKLIEGVTCIVVNDVEAEDDTVIGSTDDWIAQDVLGNVWYCGEIAENFETFEGDEPETPELVDIDGSWKAGRDGAKAGILFPAVPAVGDFFRQELAWSDAEDVIEIVSVTGTESTPAGACNGDCVVTRDFSALEPGAEENKFYAPGIGLIVELDPETGERLELIEVETP